MRYVLFSCLPRHTNSTRIIHAQCIHVRRAQDTQFPHKYTHSTAEKSNAVKAYSIGFSLISFSPFFLRIIFIFLFLLVHTQIHTGTCVPQRHMCVCVGVLLGNMCITHSPIKKNEKKKKNYEEIRNERTKKTHTHFFLFVFAYDLQACTIRSYYIQFLFKHININRNVPIGLFYFSFIFSKFYYEL